MAPGTSSKFGAPMFERAVFRKKMYCIQESTCHIVGTFRRSGNCAPPSWYPCLKLLFAVQSAHCGRNIYTLMFSCVLNVTIMTFITVLSRREYARLFTCLIENEVASNLEHGCSMQNSKKAQM